MGFIVFWSNFMNKELIEEINYEILTLIDSGFYLPDEILEIIEEQFIDEDISLDIINNIIMDKYDQKIAKESDWEKPTDFDALSKCFHLINKENIIAIHNAGFTIDEGVHDAFEVFHHLQTKNMDPIGFCFYNFQDIEIAINYNLLNIAFGDFSNNKERSLAIGKKIAKIFKDNGFSIKWDENINTRIEINPFHWKKAFDDNFYEMEGAFKSYLDNNK